jgi:hypothetical protein
MMTVRAPKFKSADVKRLIGAARAEALEVGRVEVRPDGTISVFVKSADDQSPEATLKKWKASRAR